MKQIALFALPLVLAATPAFAATQPNLGVSLSAPTSVPVYDTGHYAVTVTNSGNRNAGNVVLTIQLPVTHTSPTVHVLGTLGARDGRCSLSGTRLICGLGTIARFGGSTVVGFDLALPYSTAPLVIDAAVTTTTLPETNPGNNSLSYTATPATVPTSVAGPIAAVNQSCTGTGLTSFFECLLYPSSIQGFDSTLELDGSVTIPEAPDATGQWAFTSPDRLVISYSDQSGPIGTLDARSVGGGCFEGPMTFPTGNWVAIYEVCLVP